MEKSLSHSVGCQVPLLIVSFALHSFLVYYNFNLSTVAFVVYGLGGSQPKKYHCSRYCPGSPSSVISSPTSGTNFQRVHIPEHMRLQYPVGLPSLSVTQWEDSGRDGASVESPITYFLFSSLLPFQWLKTFLHTWNCRESSTNKALGLLFLACDISLKCW